MDVADPGILRLRPAELDWLDSDELAKYSNLILQLPRSGEIQQAARARVAIKRAERLRLMSSTTCPICNRPTGGMMSDASTICHDQGGIFCQIAKSNYDRGAETFDRVFAGVTSEAMDELLAFIDPNGVNETVNGDDLVTVDDPHLEIFRAFVRAHDELKARGR